MWNIVVKILDIIGDIISIIMALLALFYVIIISFDDYELTQSTRDIFLVLIFLLTITRRETP